MNTAMTQQARIRRLQDTLIIAGDGVIAFSVWSLAKTGLFLIFVDETNVRHYFNLEDALPMMSLFIAVALVLLVDLLVRAYIGFSARAEGAGKKKGPFYLIVAMLAGFVNASSAIAAILGNTMTVSILDVIISFMIEATALATIVVVIYCSLRLRSLKKAAG